MGLISRVSSRTYRQKHFYQKNRAHTKKNTKKMKLTHLAILTLLSLTTLAINAQDSDDITIDDDGEADIENEDDATEAEYEVDENEEADEEQNMNEQEHQPQLMPNAMEGIRSFSFFPEGAHSITGGKMSELVIGVQNNGDGDIEMVSCQGRMTYPNSNEVVQNFTNIGYEKQNIFSKSEASFSYGFIPYVYTGGREFDFTIEIYYKKTNSNLFYRATPFNSTVNVLESTDGVATEIACLWLTIFVILIVGSYVLYKKFLTKWLKIKPASGKKIETGTMHNDVDLSWIPKGHRTTAKKNSNKVD